MLLLRFSAAEQAWPAGSSENEALQAPALPLTAAPPLCAQPGGLQGGRFRAAGGWVVHRSWVAAPNLARLAAWPGVSEGLPTSALAPKLSGLINCSRALHSPASPGSASAPAQLGGRRIRSPHVAPQVLCWQPGQVSRIHDHQKAHGWVTVLDVSGQCPPSAARLCTPSWTLHELRAPVQLLLRRGPPA